MTPRSITLPARTLVVGALALLLAGAALHASLAHPATVTQTKPAPRSTSAGPNVERDGLLAGFTHNQAGALTAATTYVREGQRVFDLPPAGRTAALRSIAASAAADGFVADQAAQLAELDGAAQRGTGPLTWMVAVLATRMDAYTPQRARVSLWRVGILSVDGMTSPLAEWTTVDYELVWEAGDWRIWSETQVPGPTPLGDPNETLSSPSQWRAELNGYSRFPGADPLQAGVGIIDDVLSGLGWIWSQTGQRAVNAAWDQMINGMVSWVTDAISWFVGALLRFFEHSSTPNLAAGWFSGNGAQSPYGVVAALALSLLLLFVLVAVVQGALSGDGVAMAARLARDIPLAILGITATIGVTQVLLGATDELSHAVLDGTGAGAQAKTVLEHLGSAGAFSGQATFVVFILGLFAVVGAFLLWIELLIRASLLYVLLACSPLAFACFVWPAARRVLHRLVELILALVLSKVVIAIALAVAASALTQGTTNPAVIPTGEAQVGTLLVGVIMFLLAALAPFVVLKLFPVVEAAVVAQGISRAPARTTQSAVITSSWVARLAGTGTGALAGASAAGAAAGSRPALGGGAGSPPAGNDARATDTRDKGTGKESQGPRRSRDLANAPDTTASPAASPGPGADLAGRDQDATLPPGDLS